MTNSDSQSGALLTLAETSAFRRTGRTDEVARLSEAFARQWPQAVRSFEYGRSAEGRSMRALIASRTGSLTSEELRARQIPILMIQGGIHPGESDGKDAGFIALREMLSGEPAFAAASQISTQPPAPGVLDRIALLFVPAFNTDGHERFGRWSRPNQRGPEEMGWRTTAQNLNLNRDYTKAESPEMQAMLRLLNEWDPLVCADLHVTDGADFEPDVSIQVEPINQGDESLRPHGERMRDELIAKLAAQGSIPLPFYPDLAQTDNPASGFLLTVYSPRFSTGYFPARNRFTTLVETHSWKDYPTRVRVTRNCIVGLAELMATHGGQWLEAARRADENTARLAGESIPLDYESGWREPTPASTTGEQTRARSSSAATSAGRAANNRAATDAAAAVDAGQQAVDAGGRASIQVGQQSSMIEFRGYAYKRERSEISGGLVTVFDPKTPQIWRVPFVRNVAPTLVVEAPKGGYVVPRAYAQSIGIKLALHGIRFEQLQTVRAGAPVQTFCARGVRFANGSFEGRSRVKIEGEWQSERCDIPAGSLFVPIGQRLARLVMALLEPRAPDSFAAWGFFNSCFEQKELIEPYVAEMIARDMLKNDAAVAAEFRHKLAHDPAFAASPTARLEFFHCRHESWDEQLNRYPIYRTQAAD